MSEIKAERSLVKGILAGVLAGVAATAAKAIAEKMYAPRDRDAGRTEDTNSAYTQEEMRTTGNAFTQADWAFGIAAGAAYGALAEFYPAAASGGGKTFGLALMTLTHETALPSPELDAEFEDEPNREQTSEAASHLVFGTVAEQVRSYVRALL